MDEIVICLSADWHIDESNFYRTTPPINAMIDIVEDIRPDLFIHAGDLYIQKGSVSPTALVRTRDLLGRLADSTQSGLVIIPGNHDASNSYDRVDSVRATISRISTNRPIYYSAIPLLDKIPLYYPEEISALDKKIRGEIQILFLPTPNKYIYLSRTAGEEIIEKFGSVTAAISAELEAVVRNLQKDINPSIPSILIYHGSFSGALADSEKILSTGIDIAIDKAWIDPARVDVALCGHLHKRQTSGIFHYPGSPAPHSQSHQAFSPGFTICRIKALPADWNIETLNNQIDNKLSWKSGAGARLIELEKVDLPIESQFLTVDVSPEDFDNVPEGIDPGPYGAVAQKLIDLGPKALENAIVRIRIDMPEELIEAWDDRRLDGLLCICRKSTIEKNRISPIKIRSEEISLDQNIQDLISRWIDLNSALHPIRPELLEFSEVVERKLPKAVSDNQLGADYQPELLEFENYKQYGKGEIRFLELGKINAISGLNKAGKSNAAEAEAFALFKYMRPDSTLRDIVKRGETNCKVSLYFLSKSKNWKLTRTIRIQSSGKASADLLLEEQISEGIFEPVNLGEARSTQDLIEELVGPPDLYYSTRYASQFDIDRILRLRPRERKDMLQQALRAEIFSFRVDIAKEFEKIGKSDIEGIRKQIEQEEKRIGNKDPHSSEFKSLEAGKEKKKERLDVLGKELDDLYEKSQASSKRIGELESELRGIKNKKDRLEKYNQDIGEEEKELIRLGKTVLEAPIIEANKEALDELLGREKAEQEKALEESKIQNRINEINHQSQIKTKEWEQKKKEAVQNWERARELADVLYNVPCGGEGDFRSCKFIQKASKARDEIDALETAVEHAEELGETLLEEETKARQKELDNLQALGYSKEDHDKLKADIKRLEDEGWKEKAVSLQTAGQVIKEKEGSLSRLKSEAEELRKEILESEGLDNELKIEKEALDVINYDRETKLNAHRKLKETYEEDLKSIGTLKGLLEEIKKSEELLRDLRKSENKLAQDLHVISAYLGAVSRDGIPSLILEQAIPELERLTNYFLEDSPLSVVISPLRDFAGGQVKEEIHIRFKDPDGEYPLSEASGFDKIAIGLSLRAAIAKIHSMSSGFKIFHIFIDEGFGAMDPMSISWGKLLISRLAEEFEKVLFISHIDSMREIADTNLRVERQEGSSTIVKAG